MVDYFEGGFPAEFPRILGRNGNPLPGFVRFWAGVRARAAELYGVRNRSVKPGIDFAITEVVRCKSRAEVGVPQALSTCLQRHFARTLSQSPAVVVVILGETAAKAIKVPAEPRAAVTEWFGRTRHLLWLPHTNARMDRTFAKLYADVQLSSAKADLAAARAGSTD